MKISEGIFGYLCSSLRSSRISREGQCTTYYELVTCPDGEPIGFVTWDPRNRPEYVEIGHNGIRENYKRQGYGHRQLEEGKIVNAIKKQRVWIIWQIRCKKIMNNSMADSEKHILRDSAVEEHNSSPFRAVEKSIAQISLLIAGRERKRQVRKEKVQ